MELVLLALALPPVVHELRKLIRDLTALRGSEPMQRKEILDGLANVAAAERSDSRLRSRPAGSAEGPTDGCTNPLRAHGSDPPG
jgi:hypothetical protein